MGEKNVKNEPLRVAQMMTDMNFGGVEMVIMNYYRNIDRSKVQFDFLALEDSLIPQKAEIERLGGRIYVVPRYTHLVRYEREVQRILRENRYHIVHSNMNTLSVFALYAAKKVGVPVRILHNHSTAGKGESKKNILKYLLRPFAKVYATDLCACSQHAGKWIFGKNTDYRVINNAIDLERYHFRSEIREQFRKELGIENDFVLGHVGRFCFQKNHEFLIEVFEKVVKSRPDSKLLLIGEGKDEERVRALVSQKELSDNVLFLGKQTDVSPYYQAMDCFVLPSRYEGLGMVAIEAQACGLPTICSTEVPEEAAITNLVKFLGLDLPSAEWANEILKCRVCRRDMRAEIRRANYDIKIEADKLLMFYESKEAELS